MWRARRWKCSAARDACWRRNARVFSARFTANRIAARGFPLQVPRVIKILRDVGARIAVVYHDVQPYSGGRAVDQLRRFLQRRAMRQALGSSDQAILTVPAEKLSWISAGTVKDRKS